MSGLVQRDARVLWHPYTQHALEDPPLAVRAACGATLTLDDGREVLDAISSWWACLHGHGHPRLVEAMSAPHRRTTGQIRLGCWMGTTMRSPALKLS